MLAARASASRWRRSPPTAPLAAGRRARARGRRPRRPSLAILTLALPLLGLGFRPALLALVVLALPPIVVNTDVGLRAVPRGDRSKPRAERA